MTIAPHLAYKVRPFHWRESDHPRDRLGRWIETGALVRLWGGIGGRVTRNLGGGRIEVQRPDGSSVSVHRNYLTVVERPDGAAPASLISAKPAALPEQPDAAANVEAIEPPPAEQPKPDPARARSIGAMLRRTGDSTADYMAGAVESAARAYLDALDNDVPGDEAEARGNLIGELDVVLSQFGDVRGMREAVETLRETTAAEPDRGGPDGSTGDDRGAALPAVPAEGVREGEGQGDVLPADGGPGAGGDRRDGGRPDAAADDDAGAVRGDAGAAADGPEAGRVARDPGDAARPDAARQGDAGGPGDRGSDDGVRATPGDAAPVAERPTSRRLTRISTDLGQGSLSPSDNLIAIRQSRGYAVYRRNDDPSFYEETFTYGGFRYGHAGDTATLSEFRTHWVNNPDLDHASDTLANPDIAARAKRAAAERDATTGSSDAVSATGSNGWTLHERNAGGHEIRDSDGQRIGGVFQQAPGRFVARPMQGDDEGVGDTPENAFEALIAVSGGDTDAPSPAPESVYAVGDDVEVAVPDFSPAGMRAGMPEVWRPGRVARVDEVDGGLVDVSIEPTDGGAPLPPQRVGPRGGNPKIRRTRDTAAPAVEPVADYDPAVERIAAPVATERIVWQSPGGREADYVPGPDDYDLRGIAGSRVRVRFFDDEDNDTPGEPEVGRWIEQGTFPQHEWLWEPEGGDAYPIDVDDIHSITQIPEAVDPDQGNLFDPEEPSETQIQAALARLRAILDDTAERRERGETLLPPDPSAPLDLDQILDDTAARRAASGPPALPPGAEDMGRTRTFGPLTRRYGTVYTTNGGEATGWITTRGSTYPLDVEMPDGRFLGLPGYRVDSIRVEDEPTVTPAVAARLTTDADEDAVPGTVPVDLQPEVVDAASVAVDRIPATGPRFTPPRDDNMAPVGEMGKLDGNIAALQTLRLLQREGRPATADEQTILSRWAGWGGVPGVFDPDKAEFDRPGPEGGPSRRALVYSLLSPGEINEARRNTLNAHYTDPRAVAAVWDAVEGLGFGGGRVLEPGSGSGTFIGLAPEGADMVGVELDSTTAALSKYLYPDAQVRNESFADTSIPDGAFDAVVGNVPFGRYALTDPVHNPDGESIHNHFILKSLALTRPGGIVAVLSSRHTLDSKGSAARAKMYAQADLVGAVRLPNGSHQRASGTNVIEDVLIFRKRPEGDTPGDDTWVGSTKRDLPGYDEAPISFSDYFAANPEHVLGAVGAIPGQFGSGEVVVTGDVNMPDLRRTLDDIVAEAVKRDYTDPGRTPDAPLPTLLAADSGRHEGHIEVDVDGNATQATQGTSVPLVVPSTQIEELRSLTGIRDTLGSLLDAETSSSVDTEQITTLRADLNTRYDAYVARYGPVNRYSLTKSGARKRPAQGGFRSDPLSAAVRALETYDPSTGEASKASVFTQRAVAPRAPRDSADNPADALALSMETYGEVNMRAIADLLDVDQATAREQMRGYVYEEPVLSATQVLDIEALVERRIVDPDATPDFDLDDLLASADSKMVPAAEYLSGHVRRKHAIAALLADADERYTENRDALAAVLPRDLGPTEIDGSLGAPWIDAPTVEKFVANLLGDYGARSTQVRTSGGGIWTVKGDRRGVRSTDVWGTPRKPAPEIIQALLEQRTITVTKDGKQDLDATIAAQAKAEEIQERFRDWLWEDPERARRLQAKYNYQFNGIALRTYDGSQRAFPGMSEEFKPHPHVKDAVERIVNEPTAMLAHVVGAGKTAEMVMGTQELRRMGLARKPAIVVPNHMLEQFTREYLEIYPTAKILAAGSADLRGDGRREFAARAATGDWDSVIITQDAFESIPMGQDQQQAYIDRELAYMREALEAARASADDSTAKRTVKKMETELVRAEEAMKKKMAKAKDVGVTFEQTGIDYVMVDEAHMYANLRTPSRVQGAGIPGSGKATDLHMKIEYLRENSKSGRVATFATGTPIRNSITQAYVMQRFLRPDLLHEAGVHNFDQWSATFGTTVTEMELKPEGNGYRQKVRFAKFRNVPEMLRMFHTFADVKLADDLTFLNRPDVRGGGPQTIAVPRSAAQAAYIADLGDRAEAVRSGTVEPEEDNMLKISTDGRKAALSMALIPGGEYEDDSKIQAAADTIYGVYADNRDRVYVDPKTGDPFERAGAGQMVFLDMGTPKGAKDKDDEATVDDNLANWNAYDTLKAELVERGMEPASVRYIHEAKNDAQKDELFAGLRNGSISVLIGSSDKMGVGTNAQKRLLALHHIDAPWRPADVEQRDGRAIRHGNLNEEVQIYRYVTEGSFDAYMWQTLERKAKFINQIMRGSLDVREIEDVGDTAMSYAEVKALATGNPDLLEKAKVDTVVQRLSRLQRGHERSQTNMRVDIDRQTDRAETLVGMARALEEALGQRRPNEGDDWTMTVDRREYAAADDVEVLRERLPAAPTATSRFARDDDGAAEDVFESDNPRMIAAEALRRRALRLREEGRFRYLGEVDLGTIAGFTITGQTEYVEGGSAVRIGLRGVPYSNTLYRLDNLRPGQERYLLRRLEGSIARMEIERDKALEQAANLVDEVRVMEGRIDAAFDQGAMLAAATAKADRLAAKIQRDSARAEGREIDFDPAIDTDRFDSPLVGGPSADTDLLDAPPEVADARRVSAGSLAEGTNVEFDPTPGEPEVGTVVSVATVGGRVLVTIRGTDGQTYERAYDPTTSVRIGQATDEIQEKGMGIFERRLAVVDGHVQVTVEVKRRGSFREVDHPRDRMGRWIETGAEVRIWGGGTGRIMGMAGGGRVTVARTDGSTVNVDAGNVTVVKNPLGERVNAPGQPDPPAAAAEDAPGAPGAPTGTPRRPGTARDAARSAKPAPRTSPAPDATPDGAAAVFEAPDGARAWLDDSGPEPVGYSQEDPDNPDTTMRYEDVEEWADEVDAAGMDEVDDDGVEAGAPAVDAGDPGRSPTGPPAGDSDIAVDDGDPASTEGKTALLNRPIADDLMADFKGTSAAEHMLQGDDGVWRFTPERQALHQQILDSFLSGFEPQENPRYHVMGGGPAAGKSTMESANPEISEGHALLNADEIKEALPEYNDRVSANDPTAAGFVHEESSYLVKAIQSEAFRRKINVTLDGTGNSSAAALRKKMDAARAAGYSVHGYYVTAETDEAVRRAIARGERTGRFVAEHVIRNTHRSVSAIFEDVADDFDSVKLYDTQASADGGGPAMILVKEPGGNVKVIDPDLYAKFLAKATE